jgi:hypothetical protein
MHERFNQIDIQLGRINGNIQEVQESLLGLDLTLSRIERNNFEFINALGRRPLLEAINGGLGYAERTGKAMPYQPDFVNYENVLHSWATIHAFDPINAGPTQRDYSDAQLLTELNAYPLDSNLNYLNGWMILQGLPPIANKYLPSPRDWLFASRAYAQLGVEWPAHMRGINTQRQEELNQIGLDLETAMNNLSTQLTQGGPQGNNLLFSTVITYYTNKLDRLDAGLQAIENNFVSEVHAFRLQHAEPFNLYGGVDQPLTFVSPELTNSTCGNMDGYGSYPLSSNLKALIPNFERYNLADYLKVGKLAVCLADEWTNPMEECIYPPQSAPYCYMTAEHKSMLTVYFDQIPLMRQTIDEGRWPLATSPDDWTRTHWTTVYNYKGKFDALTVADMPSPEMEAQRLQALGTLTAQLEEALANYQKELYARILNEMELGSLKSLATEVGGARTLLDAFATLGLQRAVHNDEFLHAMLFGNQQLVGNPQIMQSYALSITQPISGTALHINPRQLIEEMVNERTELFEEMIRKYLDAITAGKHTENTGYIASTRRMLNLTMRIVKVISPAEEEDEIVGLQASSNGPTLLGNPTNFVASVTAGSNVSFTWSFGDGNTATGATSSHTYAAAGLYTVNLTARNPVSEERVQMLITVEGTGSGQNTQQIMLPLIQR